MYIKGANCESIDPVQDSVETNIQPLISNPLSSKGWFLEVDVLNVDNCSIPTSMGPAACGETNCDYHTIKIDIVDVNQWGETSLAHELTHLMENCAKDNTFENIYTPAGIIQYGHPNWIDRGIFTAIQKANLQYMPLLDTPHN